MTRHTIPKFTGRGNDLIRFQHLNITQNGFLENWVFVSTSTEEGSIYPKIFTSNSSSIINEVENTNCTETSHPNVHECSVVPSVVKAGDHVGVELLAPLQLIFISLNGVPPGESLDRGMIVQGFPLITVGVGKPD